MDLGGGGANFCSVEYNPHDTVDPETGNVPHSIRVVVENTVGQGDVGLAIWKAKEPAMYSFEKATSSSM